VTGRPRFGALVGIGGLAALILAAVWQLPQWLDWTSYRPRIETLAAATLGQPVHIRGPIAMTLLPEPVLTATQVTLGGSDEDELSIKVSALRLRVAFWPLIRGRIDARELILRGPDVRIPWPPSNSLPRPPAWLAASAARIEDGRLSIGRHTISDVDATLTRLETGAVALAGSARFNGQDWHLAARLTAAGYDGVAGLNATLDGQGAASDLGVSFSGQMAHDGSLSGRIAARGQNLAVLIPAPAVPFRADGRLSAGSGVVAVNDLMLEIGGSPATGAVRLRFALPQRLDIALAANRFDLDAWLPVLLRAETAIAASNVPIGVDIAAEAAPLAGGTVEHLRATYELTGNSLVVREATALLPGNGALRLRGQIERVGAVDPRFEGDARLDAPVLRTTLHWLAQAVPGEVLRQLVSGLPDGVAQRAELSAHVAVGLGDIAVQRLSGALDDTRVSGGLEFKARDSPSLAVDLSLDHLALDRWAPGRLEPGNPVPSAIDIDAAFRLNIAQATWAGATFEGLTVDAMIDAAGIRLRRLEGTTRGAMVIASGALDSRGRLRNGKLSVVTRDATALSGLLPPGWRATPALWQGPAQLDLQAAGPPERLAVELGLSLADARLEAHPSLDLVSGAWTTRFTLRHPAARRLAETLGLAERSGLGDLPGWLGDGPLSLVAQIAGGSTRLVVQKFDLTAARLHARGDLAVDRHDAISRITGQLGFDALTLPLPKGGSDAPLPFGVLHGWAGDLRFDIGRLVVGAGPALRNVSGTFLVADDALRLEKVTAALGTGMVSGRCAVNAAANPPSLVVDADLRDDTIASPLGNEPFDLLSGHADASVTLSASGYSPSAVLATLGGHATVRVNDGVASGFDLFKLKASLANPDAISAKAAADEALSTGTTGFDRLELNATIAHGDVVIDTGRLTGGAGAARLSGGMNLRTLALEATIALRPAVPSAPEVAIHLSGPLDRPERAPELASLARWLAELAH
jgi:hypothetical protein